MVVVYSNENNPLTLKLLIAANFSKQDIDLKVVKIKDAAIPEPKHLPCLIEEDRILFIPNAAAYFLYSSSNSKENVIDEWLEWESTVLCPCLYNHFINSTNKSNTKIALTNCFKTIAVTLVKNVSVTGESLAVCDVAIWSILYPLYKDPKLSTEYLSEFPNLIKWLNELESLPEFQKALSIFQVINGLIAYQVMFSSTKYSSCMVETNTVLSPQHSTPDLVTEEEIAAAEDSWNNGAARMLCPKKEAIPIMPIAGQKNILITSALPYVNNVPHLGNIIGCVLSADVFARFCRLCNYNTLFICGTDEYGTATETKALEEGLTPQQICDKYFEVHNSIYRWFNIGFDYFGRTTTPEQTKITQSMFLELNRNGFIHTEAVEQLLCQKCDRYLADRFVEGICPHPGCNYEDARGDQCDGCGKLVNASELKNPRCKLCSTKPVTRQSEQFFLDLPKLEPLVYHWMEKSSIGWSNNARLIAKSWMKEGLKSRCITRDLKWGVPVPIAGFENKVFYVWFDAPIGYLSITERYTKDWEKWWKPSKDTSVKLYQFMAKDNVPFHSVMFPATLLGMNKGFTMVSHIMATEYLNYEDGKFSKSRGIGVFGNDAQDTGIPSDVWRFYLLYVRPESQDSSFSWNDLATKNNSELLNNLGNFVNRAQVFAEKFFNGTLPVMKLNEDDYSLLALCRRELNDYIKTLDKAKLRDGIRHILAISRHGNQYLQTSEPWVLVKGTDEEKIRAGTVVGICCNLTCLLAILLYPYMPDTSRIIRKQLNAPDNVMTLSSENPEITRLLKTGHKLGKPYPLFSKIEEAKVEELKKRFAGKQIVQNGIENLDVANLEEAVNKQADKVRLLKSSGIEKAVWQPEVKILLELKDKLGKAQKMVPETNSNKITPIQNGTVNDAKSVKELQEQVDEQALLVRNLKSSGAAKTEWQPQVNILLELKTKLSAATGTQTPTASKKSKK